MSAPIAAGEAARRALPSRSKPSLPHALRRFEAVAAPITFLVILAVWEAAVRVWAVPAFVLPAPSAIAVTAVADLTSGFILPHVWVTFYEVIAGFLAAAVAGVALGSLIALVPFAEKAIYPLILGFQTVPKVAVAPLFLIWFGFGAQSKIVSAALLAFFPILVNVIAGLRTVEPRRVLLMRALRAGPLKTFVKVRVPSMLPYVFAGFEVGVIFSVIGAVVGEFIGSSEGLGSLIIQRQAAVDVAGVFSVLIYLSLMGMVLNLVLRLVARRYAFWSRPNDLAKG